MIARHTAGPWRLEGCDVLAPLQDGETVAAVMVLPRGDAWDDATVARTEADARLVAAAPELLAALQAVLAEVTFGVRPYSVDSWLPVHLVEQARVAVAHATGGPA